MSTLTPQQFETLLPLAIAWATEQESIVLRQGIGLTDSQLADARKVGVNRPELVRLFPVSSIPQPTDPILSAATKPISSPEGLTVRYGIFIRADCWGKRPLVVHELVHTSQFERLGGFEAFLRPYLLEIPDYPNGPMEQEAVTTSERVCA